MLYISEILGKEVVTIEGTILGRVNDVYFQNTEVPNVTKLQVNRETTQLAIPITDLNKINHRISVINNFHKEIREENEASIRENLLDRQVIDLVGNKVVRVNDVVIADKPNFYISGIDISIWGVLRRLHLYAFVLRILRNLKIPVKISFLSWADIQNLEFGLGQIKLKAKEEKLNRIHPEDLADHLQTTNIANIRRFLQALDIEKAAEVFSGLSLVHQTAVVQELKPETAATLLKRLDPDEATDIVLALNRRRREHILSILPEEEQRELMNLIKLSATPMGKLLTTEYFTVESRETALEVANKIRKETGDYSCMHAVYVLNQKGQLAGVFSLHELLMENADTPVYKFMVQNPITLQLSTPLELAAKKMLRYKFSALPVIDSDKKMLGIVTLDDLSDYLLDQL